MIHRVREKTQGVDLDLGAFDLTQSKLVSTQEEASWGPSKGDADIAEAFWKNLDADDSAFTADDRTLLRSVFRALLSDRREDGDVFSPPDRRFDHVKALRALTKEEEVVRARRIEHFCSPKFVVGDAGHLFPATWTTSSKVAVGKKLVAMADRSFALRANAEYAKQADLLDGALAGAPPAFERATEDGVCFRIYRLGSLEIRTYQEPGGREAIGAVLSAAASPPEEAREDRDATDLLTEERFVKATLYVTNAFAGDLQYPQYFVVLEAESGRTIVTEKLMNGSVTWEAAPAGLERRRSIARCLRSSHCGTSMSTAGDLAAFREASAGAGAQAAAARLYAQGAYEMATGEVSS